MARAQQVRRPTRNGADGGNGYVEKWKEKVSLPVSKIISARTPYRVKGYYCAKLPRFTYLPRTHDICNRARQRRSTREKSLIPVPTAQRTLSGGWKEASRGGAVGLDLKRGPSF